MKHSTLNYMFMYMDIYFEGAMVMGLCHMKAKHCPICQGHVQSQG